MTSQYVCIKISIWQQLRIESLQINNQHRKLKTKKCTTKSILNARSLFTQQQVGTRRQYWGDKGGDVRNWLPYLTCRWIRISVLFNKHSPAYESIRDYLYFRDSFTNWANQMSTNSLSKTQFIWQLLERYLQWRWKLWNKVRV